MIKKIQTSWLLGKRKVLLVCIFFAVVFHAWFISHGYTSFLYERFRDAAYSVMAAMATMYYLKAMKTAQYKKTYLAMANFFVVILVIHLLRLIFGGLKC